MGRDDFSLHMDAIPLDSGRRRDHSRHAGDLFSDFNDRMRKRQYELLTEKEDLPLGCPPIRSNADVAMEWSYYFRYLHVLLAVGWTAVWLIQTIIYATTNKFNICFIATHDMLSGTPLVPAEQLVGNAHFYYFTMIWSLIFAFWSGYLSLYEPGFYNWYENVRHEQSGVKHFVAAPAWALATIVIAAAVGVTDVFLLIALGIISGAGEACIGVMEWFNGRQYNSRRGAMAFFAKMFNPEALNAKIGEEELFENLFPTPHFMAVPMWICGFGWLFCTGTILAFFGYAMVQNSSGIHWWVAAVFGLYVALKGFEVLVALGYWWAIIWPFTCYTYMEMLHLIGYFVVFNLIAFLVLGGGGNSGFGPSDGCLYPFTA